MKKALFQSFFFSLILHYSSFSQEFSYTHYDVSEGLAGSTVYCITQDKDGFIWTGTETGVSRFDGTHFMNFNVSDGLPDMEILTIFADSRGRIWMASFRKAVCYYYKGRIWNQNNDPQLSRIRLKGHIEHFAEDAQGNILMQEGNRFHLMAPDGMLKQYDSINQRPINLSAIISKSASGNFWIQDHEGLYELVNDHFTSVYPFILKYKLSSYLALSPKVLAWRDRLHRTAIRSLTAGNEHYIDYDFSQINFSIVADSLLYLNKTTGSTEYNIRTRTTKTFLPGIEVSSVFRDDEGNTWFTTMAKGIYRLNSYGIKNLEFSGKDILKGGVYSFAKKGNQLLVGSDHNQFFQLHAKDFSKKKTYYLSGYANAKNRILHLAFLNDGHIFIGSDQNVIICSPELKMERTIDVPVKTFCKKNRNEILIGNAFGIRVFNLTTFKATDTLWDQRVTSLYWRNDTIFAGTLNGLYLIKKDRSVVYLGDSFPFFRRRISAIAASKDGVLWIGSYDGSGIAGYKDNHIVVSLNSSNGLSSDICRALLVHDNALWVGTDKGLNRVDISFPAYPVTKFMFNDGLGSDIVNLICTDGSLMYVGTPAGLSYFDAAKEEIKSRCRLVMLSITSSGKNLKADSGKAELPYKENNIRFEFAGISYKSSGNINYRYYLTGLDTGWKDTKASSLEYPTLPAGKYELKLQAVNKFGLGSNMLSFSFNVSAPFWKKSWFYIFLVAAFFILVWSFVAIRINNIRRRQDEKEQVRKKMVEMEQMALRAQMNPHFIFNCLNSIQQYVFDQDVLAANKYISGFAKLIRATLQNSSHVYISLADELAYLSTYLELEKLRFKNKMNYSIKVDQSLSQDRIPIPAMILQPYIENSIRHGIRHKTDGQGHIQIKMDPIDGKLICTIEDNGIGREMAAQYKTKEHIEYQSKGMLLTADRIRLINNVYRDSIQVGVIDLKDEQGRATGTRIVIQFSLKDFSPQQNLFK